MLAERRRQRIVVRRLVDRHIGIEHYQGLSG
jgi:hypothetical protein